MAVKVVVIGGFLGSGKTTIMVEIGKKLVSEHGKKVAMIIANQGEASVDTRLVENFGFSTADVLQGCVCCDFRGFMKELQELLTRSNPEVVLAEPGSCAELPMAVYEPLGKFPKGEFDLAPFIILVDTPRLLSIHRKLNLLSPSLARNFFLMSHQIQEAEVLGLNKVDLVGVNELEEARALLQKLNGRAEILTLSAKTGVGFEKLINLILGGRRPSYQSTF